MAKQTLLEMTQTILSDMSSDNVSSVGDTAESERVVAILKSTYFKLMEEKNWPHLGGLLQLSALSDVTHPSNMSIPEATRRIEWIKYDRKTAASGPTRMQSIEFKHPLDFLEVLNSRNSTATNIQTVIDASGVVLNIRNDIAPTMWTSFDDTTIVFDSFDSGVESTLQASKAQVYGFKEPVWGKLLTAHAVSTAYALNDIIAVTPASTTYYYRCSVAGITAGTAPVYSEIVGVTVVDGTASFVTIGTSSMDAFVPDMPAHLFPMYLSQATAQCFNKIKQVVDSQEERDAKRQRVVMQTTEHKNRQDGQKRKVGYGRRA